MASCVYTGIREEALREDFKIPREMNPSIIVGFGYPVREISGMRMNRKPLSELVFLGKYGNRFDPQRLEA
jgi:nitroreductase